MAKKIKTLLFSMMAAQALTLSASAVLAQGGTDRQNSSAVSIGENATNQPGWLSLSEGLAAAKSSGKPVVVDVFTDWCGFCRKMDKEVFASSIVAPYMSENFVCVRINAEDGGEGQAFARKLGVHAFPTSVFLDSNGNCLSQLVGFKPAEVFLKKLQEVNSLKR